MGCGRRFFTVTSKANWWVVLLLVTFDEVMSTFWCWPPIRMLDGCASGENPMTKLGSAELVGSSAETQPSVSDRGLAEQRNAETFTTLVGGVAPGCCGPVTESP